MKHGRISPPASGSGRPVARGGGGFGDRGFELSRGGTGAPRSIYGPWRVIPRKSARSGEKSGIFGPRSSITSRRTIACCSLLPKWPPAIRNSFFWREIASIRQLRTRFREPDARALPRLSGATNIRCRRPNPPLPGLRFAACARPSGIGRAFHRACRLRRLLCDGRKTRQSRFARQAADRRRRQTRRRRRHAAISPAPMACARPCRCSRRWPPARRPSWFRPTWRNMRASPGTSARLCSN